MRLFATGEDEQEIEECGDCGCDPCVCDDEDVELDEDEEEDEDESEDVDEGDEYDPEECDEDEDDD